jgi:hypothetical protein
VALSPGIPTSFVPKQVAPETRRPRATGTNLFLMVALLIGGLALVATIGTYLYDRYLKHQLEVHAEQLAVAKRDVNQDQVEEFVRLRDRLSYGQDLLNNHVALSQVFDTLETATLTNVKYKSLKMTVANDHTAQLEIEGSARNFNALAAQSNTFAAEKRIRRAIFSGITVNKDNSVNFKLTADLDSRLIISQRTTAPATVQPQQAAPVSLPAAATTTATTTAAQQPGATSQQSTSPAPTP